MLTFAQFLTEKFATAFKGRYDYTEVWVNPTPSDFASADASQYGAILSKGKLYIWNRDAAEHVDVRQEIPAIAGDPEWLPLYVYWRGGDKRLTWDTASYSMRGRTYPPKTELQKMLRAIPGFQTYKIESEAYY